MSNEIHSLKIGNNEYPIYSTGVKLGSEAGTYFVVADSSSGNVVLGASNAISGNRDNLTVQSTNLNVGGGATTINLGVLASTVNVGNIASTVNVGNGATNINISNNSTNGALNNTVLIGADPVEVDDETTLKADWLSYKALQNFIVGAKNLNIGKYATSVNVGSSASNVNVGANATSVNVGSSASSVYFGTGTTSVNVGSSASNVNVGGGATTVNIGNTIGTSAESPRYVNIGYTSSSSTTCAYTVIRLNNKVMPRVIGTTTPYIDLGESTNVASRFRTGYFKDVNYTGTCAKSSDERLKNFGDNLKIDFDALAQIRKANYTWKDTESYGEGNDIGVSAQEVQKLYPEVVVEDPETKLLSVDYAKLSVVALAAIDELHKENIKLKSRLDTIETMIKQINNQ